MPVPFLCLDSGRRVVASPQPVVVSEAFAWAWPFVVSEADAPALSAVVPPASLVLGVVLA